MRRSKPLTYLATLLFVVSAGFTMCSSAIAGESWAVYLYLCGSDLETEQGSASSDILEAIEAELPENVKLVIWAGGSREWEIDGIDGKNTHILAHSGTGIDVVEKLPNFNMGNPQTLVHFLEICEENYPADRKMLILWNHGAGSGGGICYDELFGEDFLSFDEVKQAFSTVYGESPEVKPFEIIGFDACLMATVDMAGVCAPFANYMVASQEVEPGYGWRYDAFLSALARNPGMDGRELGRVICDSYYESLEKYGLEGDSTLSTLDLGKIADLRLALSMMSFEGIAALVDDPSAFYAEMGRGALKADVYSGGMVDLASLVQATASLFPETAEIILGAISECVVYQVVGPYRKNSNGISVFLPSPTVADMYDSYGEASGAGGMKSFYHLFEPLMTGDFSDEAAAFVSGLAMFLEHF